MPRVTNVLMNTRKVIQDSNLLKILQSEIAHEQQSSNRFQGNQSGSLGDFVLDWDSPRTQDVGLWKKCESGEEVAISALLGPATSERESKFPREVLMKICIRKPGLSSILQFDCGVSDRGDEGSNFDIRNAYYLPSMTCPESSAYKGPSFSSLDSSLQDELKNYLVSKGIEEKLTNLLLLHMHQKEQGQYVNWLLKLQELVASIE